MSENRRNNERVTARNLAVVRTSGQPDALYELVDVSSGGIRVRTDGAAYDLAVDDTVDVELEIEGEAFRASGHVVHITDGEAGIEFRDLSEKNQELLDRYVFDQSWKL